MKNKSYRYTSGHVGKSLRLKELKELDQFYLTNIRFRSIMTALKKKI